MTSMTVFIMRCCTSKRDGLRVLFAVLLLWASAAHAGGIAVDKAELRRGDGNYQAVADFVVTPNAVVEQALTHGVPLYFTSEFALIRHRWYWLNEVVAQDEQSIRLSYNALTRQYRISYGALFQNFTGLDEALHILSHQVFNQLPTASLKPGVNYVASVRMHLDLTQLPKPLQINALVNTDWGLDSDWYRWNVNADVPLGDAKKNTFDPQ
jgi:hypothetical protein